MGALHTATAEPTSAESRQQDIENTVISGGDCAPSPQPSPLPQLKKRRRSREPTVEDWAALRALVNDPKAAVAIVSGLIRAMNGRPLVFDIAGREPFRIRGHGRAIRVVIEEKCP